MKKIISTIVVIVILLLQIDAAHAQTDSTATATKKVTTNVGLMYFSDLTYGGRHEDSLQTPLLIPSATIILKNGLFLGVVGYYDLASSRSGFEGVSVTPGYLYKFNNHFSGTISFTKFFITSSSPLILSALDASADIGFYYNSKVINANITGEYIFGKSNDILNTAQLSKDIELFRLAKQGQFKITPTICTTFGTQSFYQTYYTQSQEKKQIVPSGSGDNSGGGLGGILPGGSDNNNQNPTTVTYTVTKEQQRKVKEYNLLSFDFSLPLAYNTGKWNFNVTPHVLSPFNQPGFGKNGSTALFYYSAGASVKF